MHMYVCITVSFTMWAQLCGHTNRHNESFGRCADDKLTASTLSKSDRNSITRHITCLHVANGCQSFSPAAEAKPYFGLSFLPFLCVLFEKVLKWEGIQGKSCRLASFRRLKWVFSSLSMTHLDSCLPRLTRHVCEWRCWCVCLCLQTRSY